MPEPGESSSDAFIGIDIDVEPPSGSAEERQHRESSSKRVSSKKRPPKSKSTPRATTCTDAVTDSASMKRPKKPKPPPNPPPSLVSLLQKDASVRLYFQSLQENLDYDVEKWKHEAAVWKHQASTSTTATGMVSTKSTIKTTPSTSNSTIKRSTRKTTTVDNNGGVEKKARTSSSLEKGRRSNSNVELNTSEGGEDAIIPITDEVLFGDLSDGDSSDSSSTSSSCNRKQEDLLHVDRNQLKRSSQMQETTVNYDSEQRRRSQNILKNLKSAKKLLDLLGISLVEVEVKTTLSSLPPSPDNSDVQAPQPTNSHEQIDNTIHSACNDTSTTDNSPTITKTERILHRQSDEKVAAEMMASLRTLLKCSSFIGECSVIGNSANADHNDDTSDNYNDELDQNLSHEDRLRRMRLRHYYHPFCSGGVLHFPNVYYSKHPVASNDDALSSSDAESLPDHPASVGLKHLIAVLIIMDTYCGDDLDDDEWKAIFAEDGNKCNLPVGDDEVLHEDMAVLQIGMRNRYCLTERILSSLDVEITRVWALTDRSTNLATSSVHFHPADVLEMNDPDNEIEHNAFFGAKSYSRLLLLEERVAHARIATLLYRRRSNLHMAAELVVGYIISSAPSLGSEHYPKLPPLLSLCVLEALLSPEKYTPEHSVGDVDATRDTVDPSRLRGWFRECIHDMFTSRSLILLESLAYPVRVAVRLWRERHLCADDRIRDIATVELAAFERIQRHDDGDWLSEPTTEKMTIEHMTKLGILSPISTPQDHANITYVFDSSELQVVSVISWTVLLQTLGEIDEVLRLSEAIVSGTKNCHSGEKNAMPYLFLLPGCCVAYSNIVCRRWESMKLGNTSGRQTAAAFTIEDKFSPILDQILQQARPDDWRTIDILVQCCVLLGDGHRLLKLASKVVPTITYAFMSLEINTVSIKERQLMSRTLTALVDAGEVPTVRVINLKRRPDRKYDFMACAVNKEQLIVIQGPSRLRRIPQTSCFTPDIKDEEYWGNYAFDGQCSRGDLEKQLMQRLDGKGTLTDFVSAKWRPSELKAFDANARGDFELVNTSMTEKACALSHIASWMGVEATLASLNSIRNDYVHEWYQNKLLRMFSISGFARGAALLSENEGMDPVPVCVILEDDAVLTDRFSERLSSLLEELPRDFHFCSLGYSRPKAAPMIEYSTHLSIPSCLWYLTGYVLSLEGARHLIASLPVSGPVDSWIGLKMCGNWDNQFGDIMGVGKGGTSHGKVARKDLAKIMKFRAFAAVVPLCAQKVGSSASSTMTRGGWRDRDTDITYSG